MGKITWVGPVPPDDPMFSGGPEMFSRPESKPSSTTSAPATGGAMPATSQTSQKTEDEDEDSPDLGARRIARFKHQNEQFRKMSKKD